MTECIFFLKKKKKILEYHAGPSWRNWDSSRVGCGLLVSHSCILSRSSFTPSRSWRLASTEERRYWILAAILLYYNTILCGSSGLLRYRHQDWTRCERYLLREMPGKKRGKEQEKTRGDFRPWYRLDTGEGDGELRNRARGISDCSVVLGKIGPDPFRRCLTQRCLPEESCVSQERACASIRTGPRHQGSTRGAQLEWQIQRGGAKWCL